MSINVRLPDEIARRVEAVAVERGTSVEAVAADLLAFALDKPDREPQSAHEGRHLAFAAIGASGQSRGAANVEELLAEGFGRD